MSFPVISQTSSGMVTTASLGCPFQCWINLSVEKFPLRLCLLVLVMWEKRLIPMQLHPPFRGCRESPLSLLFSRLKSLWKCNCSPVHPPWSPLSHCLVPRVLSDSWIYCLELMHGQEQTPRHSCAYLIQKPLCLVGDACSHIFLCTWYMQMATSRSAMLMHVLC